MFSCAPSDAAIARALAVEPDLIIADEPVSMLDVSIRAGILNLLKKLNREMGLSILYITHDLSTLQYICHRTGIMYLGRIVEIGNTTPLLERPFHPYSHPRNQEPSGSRIDSVQD
jgi:peptide/nickel transport system ATP-binding protein